MNYDVTLKMRVEAYSEADALREAVDSLYAGHDPSEELAAKVLERACVEATATLEPYVVPKGAERWGDVLSLVRFGRSRESGKLLGGRADGSFWITNGHTALRMPCDVEVDREVPIDAVGGLGVRIPARVFRRKDMPPRMRLKAKGRKSAYIDVAYYGLVREIFGGGLVWSVGLTPLDAVTASLAGVLVALVMPMRPPEKRTKP